MTDELTAVRTHSGGIAWLPRSLALDFVELGRCTLEPDERFAAPAPLPVLHTWGAGGFTPTRPARLTRRS